MPEGPQVFYMVHELNKKFKNSTIIDFKITGGRYERHGLPLNYTKFIKKLPSKIKSFNSKGKLVWFTIEDNFNIIIILAYAHFRLNIEPDQKHYYYHIVTDKGTFYIQDPRNFASIEFKNTIDLEKKIASRGPSIIDGTVSKKDFINIIRSINPHREISLALLDQNKISGIGNYMRADALYLAKISPFRRIEDISNKELSNLYNSIIKVVKESLASLFKYGLGSYKKKIYKKTHTKNGQQVEHVAYKGRGVYWVPSVQK